MYWGADLFLGEIFNHYKRNLKASLAFGIMLAFVFLFTFFLPNTFLASGTLFLNYGLENIAWFGLLLELALLALALAFYSIFLTLIIFAVRREMSPVRIHYYIREMLHKFTVKVFVFYAGLALILGVIAFLGMHFGPYYSPGFFLGVNVLLLIVSLAMIFVPQSIVIDEEPVLASVHNNFEFIVNYPKAFLKVVFLSLVLVALLPLVEALFDPLFSSGRFIALIVALVFVVPFIELAKSHVYMIKFGLVESTHKMRRVSEQKR